jgi:hypothetical protein
MKFKDFQELKNLVISYDKGFEHQGRTFATLFGAYFKDVAHSTMDGDIYWVSDDVPLLNKINKEVFNNNAKVLKMSEHEQQYVVAIELKKLGLIY